MSKRIITSNLTDDEAIEAANKKCFEIDEDNFGCILASETPTWLYKHNSPRMLITLTHGAFFCGNFWTAKVDVRNKTNTEIFEVQTTGKTWENAVLKAYLKAIEV